MLFANLHNNLNAIRTITRSRPTKCHPVFNRISVFFLPFRSLMLQLIYMHIISPLPWACYPIRKSPWAKNMSGCMEMKQRIFHRESLSQLVFSKRLRRLVHEVCSCFENVTQADGGPFTGCHDISTCQYLLPAVYM